MSDNQVDKSGEGKRNLQRNETGNEDPAATPLEDAKDKEETEYYEEGNGGATD